MPKYSLVIPVYKNEESIPSLLTALQQINVQLERELQAIFVVDGSPDQSFQRLTELLPNSGLKSKVLCLSRNFGSFAAIRAGLESADGDAIAVMAADLQEPPELIIEFFRALATEPIDIVFGVREKRDDSSLTSHLFWWTYKRFIEPAVPDGGVDMFGLTADFRDQVVRMREANSSLLALLFWLGGRRKFVPYHRTERTFGKSGWTLQKKITYFLDSVFAFTDLPVRLMMSIGLIGLLLAVCLSAVIVACRVLNIGVVPGYAPTMLAVLFFGALNTFGLGIVGNYAWRGYENTKGRPLNVVMAIQTFNC